MNANTILSSDVSLKSDETHYRQNADTILMIQPVAFGFNAQTAINNHFQLNDGAASYEIQQKALAEFNVMVQQLREKNIDVIVVPDTLEPHTPDSIFPNNWISFQKDNRVAMYPMFAPNRRHERRLEVVEKVVEHGFSISQMVDYSVYEKENRFLEGTGSMIFDRANRIAYAALSDRTDAELFNWFCNDFGYSAVSFTANQTVGGERKPIYHTNVMLSVAEQYVVICMESIDIADERTMLTDAFLKTGKQIVEITEKQMHNFAGNVLQIKNKMDEQFLVMSETAYSSLDSIQIDKLQKYNELIVVSVPTIEKYGGGSVRCMMAEVF